MTGNLQKTASANLALKRKSSRFSVLVRVPAKGKRAARVRTLACIVAATAGVEQEGIAARIK